MEDPDPLQTWWTGMVQKIHFLIWTKQLPGPEQIHFLQNQEMEKTGFPEHLSGKSLRHEQH